MLLWLATGMDAGVQEQVTDYVKDHAMYHRPEMLDANVWNTPFGHWDPLFLFRDDGFMLGVVLLTMVLAVLLLYRRKDGVPHGFTNMLEAYVLFIRNNIAINFLGEEDGRRMTPLFCSFFSFILLANLLGLLPFAVAPTGNVSVTLALAAVTLAFMVLGAIRKNGVLGFVKCFMPAGVPWPMLILLTPIEVISTLSKTVALTIRLFANMLAGHIIIYALLGLVVIFGWLALPAMGVVVLIYFFEVFVAFLQAYIFTLLSAVFIGLMYHPEH